MAEQEALICSLIAARQIIPFSQSLLCSSLSPSGTGAAPCTEPVLSTATPGSHPGASQAAEPRVQSWIGVGVQMQKFPAGIGGSSCV